MSATRQPAWETEGAPAREIFRHEAQTPTRQMAQSAGMKASDAYAVARKAIETVDGLRARIDALEADNAVLNERLVRIEDAPRPTSKKRVG